MPLLSKRFLLKTVGMLVSTLPPVAATLSYFPIWRIKGAEATISGISLLLILISVIPIIRAVKAALRSPSAPLVWLFAFLTFFALSKIADEVTVISFIGFISNLIGAVFFRLAKASIGDLNNEKQT